MAKATIRDIAERAGVTIATASRALNNAPDVSVATRERVLAAAADLHYTPNAIAKALKGQRTNTVAFVWELIDRPTDLMFKHFISSLASAVARNQLDLLIHPARGDSNPEDLVQILQAGRADGLILADTRPHDARVRTLHARGLPFITFGRTELRLSHPYVDVDGYAGTAEATRHLIERGHRRIAYLGLTETYTFASHRRDGYIQTLAAHGLPHDPALVLYEDDNDTQLRRLLRALFTTDHPPTALVAASDLLAITAMRAVEELGLHVGRDVAIVGFDDLPLATHTNPPLTTIHQPLDAVADILSDLLIQVITGDHNQLQHILLRPTLVVRNSS